MLKGARISLIDVDELRRNSAGYVETSRNGPYVLLKPCQRTKGGWVLSGRKTPLAVVPLKWTPLQRV
jgi:hypothetical protein